MAFPEIPLTELLMDLPEEQQELVAGGVSKDTSTSADRDENTGGEGWHADKEGDTWNYKKTDYSKSKGAPVNAGLLGSFFSGSGALDLTDLFSF